MEKLWRKGGDVWRLEKKKKTNTGELCAPISVFSSIRLESKIAFLKTDMTWIKNIVARLIL